MAFSQRHLIRFILALGCALAGATVVSAQTRPMSESPPRFRVVTMSGVHTLLFDVEGKPQTLTAGAGSFSRLHSAPPDRGLVFYRLVPAPDPASPPVKVPLARVRLPASPREGPFLVVLFKNPAGAETEFGGLVFDHSLEAHPENTYRVFNFSRRRMAVNLGESRMILACGGHDTAPYSGERNTWLRVAAEEAPDDWLLVSSGAHSVGAGTRTTIFLVDIPAAASGPAPKGIIARHLREVVYVDEKGAPHVR